MTSKEKILVILLALLLFSVGKVNAAEEGVLEKLTCKKVSLDNLEQYPSYAPLAFETSDCMNEGDERIPSDAISRSTSPSLIFEKFRTVHGTVEGSIFSKGVEEKVQFFERETVETRALRLIPKCHDFDDKWRIGLGAISSSDVAADEVFFNLISDLIKTKQIKNGDMIGWSFCKTYGEKWGHAENPRKNSTARLFLVSENGIGSFGSSARETLIESCKKNIESTVFYSNLSRGFSMAVELIKNRVKTEVIPTNSNINTDGARLWVIPPVKFLDTYFNVPDDKYQFGACQSLSNPYSIVEKE